MQLSIALSPTLALSSVEFVTDWNGDPQRRGQAEASALATKSPSFPLDPAMQQSLIVLASAVGGVVGGMTLDIIKELVKEQVSAYLKRKFPAKPPPITIDTVRQPDGAVLLVVRES